MRSGPKYQTKKDIFKLIEKTSGGCWLFKGNKTASGYGRVGWRGERWVVHRLTWTFRFGKIPQGLFVCHKCDVRPCVRPSHFFLGTQADNIRDCVKKKRHRPNLTSENTRGSNNKNAKMVEQDILMIRRLRHSKTTVELAGMFNMTTANISKICLRQTWRHV